MRVAVVVVAVVVVAVAVAAVVVAVVVRQEEVENHPALLQRKNSDQQRSCLPLGFVLLTDCVYIHINVFRVVFAGYIVELAAMMLVIFYFLIGWILQIQEMVPFYQCCCTCCAVRKG